ncbi:hypothetical protein CTI12_AA410890 [Artemisia annua]|uniref:Uncharacterized protein n=1 Tax=Artemisia annua TaxID=35608 RepID=A0A2U1M7P4_ARTAN|nr:hypothetical protein CTI12_AA410890 [Artemisia annua]
MASSSSNNVNEIKEVSWSYNMATEFKIFVNNRITQDKGCLIQYVEERNELQKKVEAIQDPISKRDRNRINMLTAIINDIIDGIRELEGQAKLMKVHEQASSDED